VVNPGDIVVGDAAGVVIVPKDDAEEILGRLRAFEGKNERYFAAIRRGDFSNKWVQDAIDAGGCRVEE
jgi:regulator of RNase E activity RraA